MTNKKTPLSKFNRKRGHCCRDRMVVVFTTTCAFSFYHHQSCWCGVPDTTLCDKVCQRPPTGRWFSLQVLCFPPPIKLTATI